MKKIDRVIDQYDSEKHMNYHLSQYEEPKESTKAVLDFILPIIGNNNFNAIDFGCGAGANIDYFSKALSGYKWVGIDSSEKYINIAKQKNNNEKIEFFKEDFFEISKKFNSKVFDVSFCLQTLLVLPYYERLMDEIFKVTNKYIIISSLFSDFDVDVISEVSEYANKDYEKNSRPYYYNVYSIEKFKKFCFRKGALDIFDIDFNIDIDLDKPKNNLMGTYTIDTKENNKMQFSGPMNMPWKFLCIKLK